MVQINTGRRTFKEKVAWFIERRTAAEVYNDHWLDFIPDSLEQAYLMQGEIAEELRWNVGGWKLGGTNQSTMEKFGCRNAYYGPIDCDHVIYSENEDFFEWNLPGPIRAEAELSFRLSKKFDFFDKLNSIEDVLEYVDVYAPSLEFPYCIIPDLDKAGLEGLVADLCGSGYLVIGQAIPIELYNLMCNQTIRIKQRDSVSKGNTSNIIMSPIQALFQFFNLAKQHRLSLNAGQWIATGGCTSCVNFIPNSLISVEFSGMEQFQIGVNQTSEKVLEIHDQQN